VRKGAGYRAVRTRIPRKGRARVAQAALLRTPRFRAAVHLEDLHRIVAVARKNLPQLALN
jgi:hypothetical protein